MFNEQVVQLEDMLIKDGLKIFKLWFSISIDEQRMRLEDRIHNPLKQWKLSTVDAPSQAKWQEFTAYKEAMFEHTSVPSSPWIVIDGNDREVARKEAIRCILNTLNYDKKGETGTRLRPDPQIVKFMIE